MKRAPSVLFVCSGNICRSPTAEGVLRTLLAERGWTGEIDSAGLLHYHAGEAPDPRAQSVAAARGYDLSDLRARALEADDVARFDHVWVMDRGHLNLLRRRFGHAANVELFLEAVAPEGVRAREVPDPYVGDTSAFERVLDLIEAGCSAALARWGVGSEPES